jgi:ABC-2 type transport system ATP-binding protein
MECAIDVQELTKDFNGFRALDGVTFRVGKGDVVGYLGPNGAGKTTTIKILTNLLRPTSGHAYICDIDVNRNPKEALRHIGSMIEVPGVYDYLTPHEMLCYAGRVHGMARSETEERIKEVLNLTRIQDWEHKRIGSFSTGMVRRLMIAQTVLHKPEILILDEPAIGLDPRGIMDVRNLIRRFRSEDITVFMSSHLLPEVSETCNSVIFLNDGKVVSYDSIEEVQTRMVSRVLEVRFLGSPSPVAINRIRDLDSIAGLELHEGCATIEYDGRPETAATILEELIGLGLRILSYSPGSASLEDYYVSIMGDERGVG